MDRIVKTFVAASALTHRSLVYATANDGEATTATSATGRPIGVVDFPGGAAIGGRVDVVVFGPAEVEAGGTMQPHAFFTANGTGKAVAAAPAAGANASLFGQVLAGAVNGDFVRAFVNPGMMQGA